MTTVTELETGQYEGTKRFAVIGSWGHKIILMCFNLEKIESNKTLS